MHFDMLLPAAVFVKPLFGPTLNCLSRLGVQKGSSCWEHGSLMEEVKEAIESTLHKKVVAIVDPLTHAQGCPPKTSQQWYPGVQ
eukprot:2700008-Amphidinium_carterae.1